MADGRQQILMLPFMAQGHLRPFLSLARLIERRKPGGFTITILTTPLNARALRSSSLLPPGGSGNVLLGELPFRSADHGLPPDSENTDSLRGPDIVRLCHASESLRPHFERFVSDVARRDGRPPACIIADVFFGWTVEVAREAGVFHCTVTTCGAYGTAAVSSLWLHLPHAGTDAEEFNLPGFPDSYRLRRSQMSQYMRAADGEDPWSTFLRRHFVLSWQSDAVLCNTVEELETAGVKILQEITGLRIWAVGPLIPIDREQQQAGRHGRRPGGVATETCTASWLNRHPPSSVLYISFGSQNTISPPQVTALATGLASSGVPFIWVIRPPMGFDLADSSDVGRWLPKGFEEDVIRRRNQGMLVRDWAPQLEILSHPSTGAFLSHCGWNSVLESLSKGVPVIGWPLASEQFYNAKVMSEELGVCVELARGVEEEVASGEVERVIKLVMGATEEGAEMRRKAGELSEVVRAAVVEEGDRRGSSVRAVDDFIRTVVGQPAAGDQDRAALQQKKIGGN